MTARVIEPEWLDALPAEDVRALRSRVDLRRVNRLMNNPQIVANALRGAEARRVLDLGAGDGWFAAKVATLLDWRQVECVLVDQCACLSDAARQSFHRINCSVSLVQRDAIGGLRDLGDFDVMFTNLFLHHFEPPKVKQLLNDVAACCSCFVACEPRRSIASLAASRLLGLIGCNSVTRHDAIASVRAGFRDRELSALWPGHARWAVQEHAAGPFSHLFVARKS